MKRSVIIIILGVITVGCILYGSYKHIYKENMKWSFKDGHLEVNVDSDENDFSEEGHYAETLPEFSKIKIDTSVAAVDFKEGTSFRIESTYGREYLKPEFEVRGNTLEVSQHKRKSNFGGHSCKLHITVPAGTSLDSINIKSNVGDIAFDKISGKEVSAEINVGEIYARDIDFEDIGFETNVGEISVYVAGGNLDDYDITLAADVGEVTVGGNSFKKSYSGKGKGNRKLSAETNVGAIKVR